MKVHVVSENTIPAQNVLFLRFKKGYIYVLLFNIDELHSEPSIFVPALYDNSASSVFFL